MMPSGFQRSDTSKLMTYKAKEAGNCVYQNCPKRVCDVKEKARDEAKQEIKRLISLLLNY